MPSFTRTPKLDPAGLYRPLDAFVTGDGFVVRATTRLRGDHAEVQRHPALWIADGADDLEMAATKEARFPTSEPVADAGDPRVHLPRVLSWEEIVVCIEAFSLRIGDSLLEVHVGDKGARDDPRFVAYRSHFRPAVEADMPAA
jgi:hypothetical protein